jgi:PBSX family phage terminase large subunit
MVAPIQYNCLPQQFEFMKAVDRVPFAAYIGGFGSGKTHILNIQVLREAIARKSLGLVGAVSYRMLADTTQRKFFELCPPKWIQSYHKSENRITLINGSEILFRSLDSPERLTNLGLDWFALDEIGEIKLETFRMLQGRLRNPGGRHKGFGVGNPAGPTHWTYDYYVLKARDMPERYHLTQATSYENTFLAASYADEMAASFGKETLYYKRFVLGQFVAFEGAYWAHFNVAPYPEGHVCTIAQVREILAPETQWRFGKVIDFGFEHPFVHLWYVTDGNKIVFFDEYHQRHATIREHCLQIRKHEYEHQSWLGQHSCTWAYTDHDAVSRAEIENCTDANNNPIGFSCAIADKKVMEGILLVQTLINQNRLYITTQCGNTRIEIPSYRSKIDITKEEPIKEKDDTCDCIRMACQMELSHTVPFLRAKDTGYQNYEQHDAFASVINNLKDF